MALIDDVSSFSKITKNDLDNPVRIRISITHSNGDKGPDKTFKIKDTASLDYMIGYIESVTDNGGSIDFSD